MTITMQPYGIFERHWAPLLPGSWILGHFHFSGQPHKGKTLYFNQHAVSKARRMVKPKRASCSDDIQLALVNCLEAVMAEAAATAAVAAAAHC